MTRGRHQIRTMVCINTDSFRSWRTSSTAAAVKMIYRPRFPVQKDGHQTRGETFIELHGPVSLPQRKWLCLRRLFVIFLLSFFRRLLPTCKRLPRKAHRESSSSFSLWVVFFFLANGAVDEKETFRYRDGVYDWLLKNRRRRKDI